MFYKFITLALLLGSLSVFVQGCSSGKVKKVEELTKEGLEVQWVKRVPDSSCEVVAHVQGENDYGSVELARNEARNKAGEVKATHVLIKDEVVNGKNWKVYGVAYRCP